jgi:hypothetical protein
MKLCQRDYTNTASIKTTVSRVIVFHKFTKDKNNKLAPNVQHPTTQPCLLKTKFRFLIPNPGNSLWEYIKTGYVHT